MCVCVWVCVGFSFFIFSVAARPALWVRQFPARLAVSETTTTIIISMFFCFLKKEKKRNRPSSSDGFHGFADRDRSSSWNFSYFPSLPDWIFRSKKREKKNKKKISHRRCKTTEKMVAVVFFLRVNGYWFFFCFSCRSLVRFVVERVVFGKRAVKGP